ncbi:MaoC/PaaZ C-terminal domain-containing protein [Streptomyces sp. H10-C2]|uniref:MaoC/PaaZ C-terminal domain-containing protein n=1 Tax=unclassified Streptomyces TaxID=2593676 RepID=UPI0024B99D21|nr:MULTISPECIES: MaoC/PaaZ C-terminal domain-containing protein [unclassified Streptomyces]MDJ0342096.1 MaoC/PaaZ C-terminal domain-containing protein [Streptomyces sp. PH10-H1]MDJ0368438.1 MaoC/PaaZ C-terminal domain-containing protein [Streptomyces sp. H10-C2]
MVRTPKEGDELPPLRIPVTRTLIVAGAIASRDFQDVHHDVELAREKGSPDIFMNILTTNGLVGRYITDWAGPQARLRAVRIRLGAPNYPGDEMVLTGKVTSVDTCPAATPTIAPTIAPANAKAPAKAPAEAVVVIAVLGANKLGHHVTGTVTVVLPIPEAAV